MKVLVVDDDLITREMVAAVLRDNGKEVVTAENGRVALEILESEEIRMVVTDWMMPEIGGLELCREIRKRGGGYTYVVMLTSNSGAEQLVEGMSAGADDFVTKPFSPEELIVRLRAGERILALESRDVTIFALARLAEARDPETGAHLERVRLYCRALCRQLRANGEFVDELDAQFEQLVYATSPLHDIGKVAIPDCVLLKPGRLNDAEFDIMKLHTTYGAETLASAAAEHPGARFLEIARDIAWCHHEWYDGSGYPRGLAGEDIPLAGRIVAVADVYDAITSKRVYKAAYDAGVARGILIDESGTHFDPRIVDAFTQIEDEFDAIRSKHLEDVDVETGPAPAASGRPKPTTA